MAIHVVIPTLQGLSAIQRITCEDPDVPSVVCLNGTAQSLPISNAYYDFVRRGQGLLAKDFGCESWRLDLSEPVEMGDSWQLAVYIAHYLDSINELGNGLPESGDTVIWATGAVRINRDVQSVDGVARKLSQSQMIFDEWFDKVINVVTVMSNENRQSVTLPTKCIDLTLEDVNDMSVLLAKLPLVAPKAPAGKRLVPPGNPKTPKLAAILLVLFIVSFGGYQVAANWSDPDVPEIAGQSEMLKLLTYKVINKESEPGLLISVKADGQANNCQTSSSDIRQIEQEDGWYTADDLHKMCEILFYTPSQKVTDVYLYSPDKKSLNRLRPISKGWSIPVPIEKSQSRIALLLAFNQQLSPASQNALNTLLLESVSLLETIPQNQARLESRGINGMSLYGLKLISN